GAEHRLAVIDPQLTGQPVPQHPGDVALLPVPLIGSVAQDRRLERHRPPVPEPGTHEVAVPVPVGDLPTHAGAAVPAVHIFEQVQRRVRAGLLRGEAPARPVGLLEDRMTRAGARDALHRTLTFPEMPYRSRVSATRVPQTPGSLVSGGVTVTLIPPEVVVEPRIADVRSLSARPCRSPGIASRACEASGSCTIFASLSAAVRDIDSIPLTKPSPDQAPIFANSFDGEEIPSRFFAPSRAPLTTPFAALTALPAAPLIPFTRPEMICPPTERNRPMKPRTADSARFMPLVKPETTRLIPLVTTETMPDRMLENVDRIPFSTDDTTERAAFIHEEITDRTLLIALDTTDVIADQIEENRDRMPFSTADTMDRTAFIPLVTVERTRLIALVTTETIAFQMLVKNERI